MSKLQNPRGNLRAQTSIQAQPSTLSFLFSHPCLLPNLCIPNTYERSLQLPPPARSSQRQAAFLWVRGKRASEERESPEAKLGTTTMQEGWARVWEEGQRWQAQKGASRPWGGRKGGQLSPVVH